MLVAAASYIQQKARAKPAAKPAKAAVKTAPAKAAAVKAEPAKSAAPQAKPAKLYIESQYLLSSTPSNAK